MYWSCPNQLSFFINNLLLIKILKGRAIEKKGTVFIEMD
jgi:hypothetical protein